ncbi:hypothetical protein RCS94_05800 [Orbaceae bacterium ac157xtp]
MTVKSLNFKLELKFLGIPDIILSLLGFLTASYTSFASLYDIPPTTKPNFFAPDCPVNQGAFPLIVFALVADNAP